MPKGEETVVLRYSFPADIPVGLHKFTVLFDGQEGPSQEFEVTPATAPLKLASPIELAGSLKTGTEWVYRFQALKEPSRGVKLSLPEIKEADPDGWLRATFIRKIAGPEADGIRADNYRNESLILTAWMVPTSQGVATTRMKSGDEDVAKDPPDLVIAVPDNDFHKSWQWRAKDGTPPEHRYEMWGPLPIKSSDGEKPGYVVLQKEPDPRNKARIVGTAAYELVPGLGLVNEKEIRVGPGNMLLMRIEVALTEMKPGSGEEPPLREPASAPSTGAQEDKKARQGREQAERRAREERKNQEKVLKDLSR